MVGVIFVVVAATVVVLVVVASHGISCNFESRLDISACQAAPATLPSTLAVAKHRQPQERQGWKQMDFAQGNSSSGNLATI